MTGSPVENNLTDAYGLIALLSPNRYGSYRSFERIHVLMTYDRFPKIIGYQNEDFLWQSLYLKGRRVTKKEAIDLPPRLVSEIQVTLADRHMELNPERWSQCMSVICWRDQSLGDLSRAQREPLSEASCLTSLRRTSSSAS